MSPLTCSVAINIQNTLKQHNSLMLHPREIRNRSQDLIMYHSMLFTLRRRHRRIKPWNRNIIQEQLLTCTRENYCNSPVKMSFVIRIPRSACSFTRLLIRSKLTLNVWIRNHFIRLEESAPLPMICFVCLFVIRRTFFVWFEFISGQGADSPHRKMSHRSSKSKISEL